MRALFILYISLVTFSTEGFSQCNDCFALDSVINSMNLGEKEYLKKSHSLFQKAKDDSNFTSKSLIYMGSYHMSRGILDSAIIYFERGRNTGIKRDIGRHNLGLGLSQSKKGQYIEAYKTLENTKQYLKSDTGRLAILINNQAIILKTQKDYPGARKYYRETIKLNTLKNKKIQVAAGTLNLGLCYLAEQKFDSAYFHIQNGLNIAKKQNATRVINACYSGMVNLHMNLLEGDSALLYIDSIRLQNDDIVPYREAGMLVHEIGIRIGKGELKKSKNLLNRLNIVSQKLNSQEFDMHYYALSSKLNALKGNYELALKQRIKCFNINDSLFNEEKIQEIASIKHSAEINKKELELSTSKIQYTQVALEKEKEILRRKRIELRNSVQTSYILYLLIGLLTLAFISLLLILINRKRNVEKRIAIEKSIQKEILMGEVHHRVKNNLQMVSSMLFLEANSIKNDDAKESLSNASNRIQMMSLLHQRLYEKNNFQGVFLNEYIKEIVDNAHLSNSFEVERKVKGTQIKVDTDTTVILGLILNELVINAYKYAFSIHRKNFISIETEHLESAKELVFIIKDSSTNKIKLDSESASFGLKLIQSFTRQLKGTINFDYEAGNSIQLIIKKFKIIDQ